MGNLPKEIMTGRTLENEKLSQTFNKLITWKHLTFWMCVAKTVSKQVKKKIRTCRIYHDIYHGRKEKCFYCLKSLDKALVLNHCQENSNQNGYDLYGTSR